MESNNGATIAMLVICKRLLNFYLLLVINAILAQGDACIMHFGGVKFKEIFPIIIVLYANGADFSTKLDEHWRIWVRA